MHVMPCASSASARLRFGTCPAQSTIVSVSISSGSRRSGPWLIRNPSGVIASYVTPARKLTSFAARLAVDPAGGLAEVLAGLGAPALQERDPAGGRRGARAFGREAAAGLGRVADAPFAAQSAGSSVGEGPEWARNSATSKPMPPAPTMATRSPTAAPPRRTSM
jgi:hypothetical protein